MKKLLIAMTMICLAATVRAQKPSTFKWVPWKNVSVETKNELKKIKDSKLGSAYDAIISDLGSDCTIDVAVLDMDGDGQMEYAVGSEGGGCCGSLGCGLNVYSDSGRKRILLHDEWRNVKPAKTGVVSTKGVLIRFKKPTWF